MDPPPGAHAAADRRVSGRGGHDGFATTGAGCHHKQFGTNLLDEVAVLAGHHINPGEPPDFSSCFGDRSLAVTAFQIRGRVFDDVGCNEMGRCGHRAILRRASCHPLRGKRAISEEFVENLLSGTPCASGLQEPLKITRGRSRFPPGRGPGVCASTVAHKAGIAVCVVNAGSGVPDPSAKAARAAGRKTCSGGRFRTSNPPSGSTLATMARPASALSAPATSCPEGAARCPGTNSPKQGTVWPN